MSKVKPILYMLGKGGISVLQTSIFSFGLASPSCQEQEASEQFKNTHLTIINLIHAFLRFDFIHVMIV